MMISECDRLPSPDGHCIFDGPLSKESNFPLMILDIFTSLCVAFLPINIFFYYLSK